MDPRQPLTELGAGDERGWRETPNPYNEGVAGDAPVALGTRFGRIRNALDPIDRHASSYRRPGGPLYPMSRWISASEKPSSTRRRCTVPRRVDGGLFRSPAS